MKRILLLILSLALCLSLIACGGNNTTGNPDHDYVIALMEKGDYAMAITVLEHLMEESGDIPGEKEQTATAANPDTPSAPAEPTAESSVSSDPVILTSDADRRQLAIDTLCRFMDDKGNDLTKAYKKQSGSAGREPVVVHAMEYWLENCDGNGGNAHCLLIELEMDIFDGSGFVDRLQLLLDMDTQKVYHSAELDWNLISSGDPQSVDAFCNFLLNGYASYLLYDADIVWSERENFEELSSEDILAMNDALK